MKNWYWLVYFNVEKEQEEYSPHGLSPASPAFAGAQVSSTMPAVEIKVSNAHANSENTFNPKKSPAKAKAKILEGDEGKQFKTDHFEKAPKPNPSHVSSTAAAKPDTPPLTSTSRAGKHEGRTILTGAISKDSDDIEIIL